MNCPKCGAKNNAKAKFCIECATPFAIPTQEGIEDPYNEDIIDNKEKFTENYDDIVDSEYAISEQLKNESYYLSDSVENLNNSLPGECALCFNKIEDDEVECKQCGWKRNKSYNKVEIKNEEIMNKSNNSVNQEKPEKNIGKIILLSIASLGIIPAIGFLLSDQSDGWIIAIIFMLPLTYIGGIYWLKSKFESEQLKKSLYFIHILIGLIIIIIGISQLRTDSDNNYTGESISKLLVSLLVSPIPFAIVYAMYWFETPSMGKNILQVNNSNNNQKHTSNTVETVLHDNTNSGFQVMGNYKIIFEIGKGGMGTVYLAQDQMLGRQVALKVLPQHLYFDNDFKSLFKREINTLATLDHPAIVPIYSAGEENDRLFYSMKFIKGENLADFLKENRSMDIPEIIKIVSQVCEALSYAHEKKVLHRDLKPANIMIDVFHKAYITDFGIAKIISDESALTKSKHIAGTPFYMPPEAFTGKGYDIRSDLYSLGIILYEMITGVVPFDGDMTTIMYKHVHEQPDLTKMEDKKISPVLKDVVLKLLEKDKEMRFKNSMELKKALNSIT